MANLPGSSLPPEAEYWDRLAAEIRRDAAAPMAAYAASRRWYGSLAYRAPWLVAASLVAMLVLWLTLPPRESATGSRRIENALAPHEVAGTLVGGPSPPTIELLMVQFPPPDEATER